MIIAAKAGARRVLKMITRLWQIPEVEITYIHRRPQSVAALG